MKNEFHYCPNCGGKRINNINMRKWQCDDCGFVLYNNAATSVALIIRDNFGRVLFEVRAKEPAKSLLALPGGFVEPGESAEQACVRECAEEIGISPINIKYLVSFPNTYDYKNIQYKTCDMFFLAELEDMTNFKPQNTEVMSIKWCNVNNIQDVMNTPLAFDSARNALEFYIKNK